ncbi:MAG: iron-containing redox enzyme family protein [Alphaproteobacteria bacterium]|nr:iron-containing redox enzyme family protein [Alphaproteobacteria bacterium]
MTTGPQEPKSGTPQFYDRLVAETRVAREKFLQLPFIQAAFKGDISREAYIEYLCEAYHHVRHTVPLIAEVRRRIPEDRVPLHIVLEDYVLGRQGHEKWILHDIKEAGGDADAAKARAPSPATNALVNYAYDTVRNVTPVAYFGMAFVVEATGSKLAAYTVDTLMHKLGLPQKCFSYMLSHGNTEMEQMDSFEVLMAQITDPEEQEAIIDMACGLYPLYSAIFQHVADTIEENSG